VSVLATENSGGARLSVCKNDALSEPQLEAQIEAAMQRMCTVSDRAEKMRHWRELCRLIDERTPERRRFMARTRGLA
jgi:hypothetical protein